MHRPEMHLLAGIAGSILDLAPVKRDRGHTHAQA